ncbi:hypothetical protein NPIL_27971 [Nephila pilipes]|uniref:Uncharacterized protein n=1 Tax=Nephila pilipes TaxID=299642 RepID=A0A8X6UC72_NEPPI|nr:hypothetical protein NPIL_27971 [Nephila pilipes]
MTLAFVVTGDLDSVKLSSCRAHCQGCSERLAEKGKVKIGKGVLCALRRKVEPQTDVSDYRAQCLYKRRDDEPIASFDSPPLSTMKNNEKELHTWKTLINREAYDRHLFL